MTFEEIRELQSLQVEAMKVVDIICRKNNIKYYMIGGTLIGAVRHKGFIPWDFDSDIAMYRNEYERFLKLACLSIPAGFTLQYTASDDTCEVPFARLIVNNVNIIKPENIYENIHLDIFVLDFIEKGIAPVNKIKEKLILLLGYIRSYNIKKWKLTGKGSWWKNCILKAGNLLTRNFKGKDFDNLFKKIIGYKNYKTLHTTITGSRYGYIKDSHKSEYFNETIELEFEGNKFLAPAGYHEILKKTYGDYMLPPPENQRYPPDFENYKVIFKK